MHGLGQPMASLSLDEAAKAVYMEMIGQTFAVLGMAIAKLSLGLLLLRLVEKQWHQLSIWTAMISLSIISMITAVILWVQRVPSKSIYDSRVTGHSIVSVTPFSVWLGSRSHNKLSSRYFELVLTMVGMGSVVYFGWLLLRHLAVAVCLETEYEAKEKTDYRHQSEFGDYVRHYTCSLVPLLMRRRAGICGIIRTVDLGGLSSANYTGEWSPIQTFFRRTTFSWTMHFLNPRRHSWSHYLVGSWACRDTLLYRSTHPKTIISKG